MAWTTARWRRVTLCSALVAALATTACTSSKHPASGGGSTAASTAAARWWSNSVVAVGSTISATDPGSAAAKLLPSRSDYCGMLKQTLQVGKSVLPSGSPSNPKQVTSTEAFVAEIERVAPAGVSASWQVVGPVILQLVKAGGSTPTSSTVGTAQNLQAAEAINADSKKNCNLDLSSVVTGG